MENIYIIMFAVGVIYTFVSFIISGISGAIHLGGQIGHMDGHFGGHGDLHGHMGGHGDASGGHMNGHTIHTGTEGGVFGEMVLSWFSVLINPIVAVSFLTISGGLGILGTHYLPWTALWVFLTAVAAGAVCAFLLYRFIAIPLYRSENSSDISREELAGTAAEVVSTIIEDGFGTIRYTVNSIRSTAPAKHIEGKSVLQGEKVIICKIEMNVFYVTEFEEI